MTSIHDFVGGDYMKADDLKGKERTAQLSGFKVETLKGDHGDERKVIATFADQQKGMVINKTNATVLLGMFATDQIEEWTTKVQAAPTFVVIYTEHTQLGDGLRIRPMAATESPASPPQMDADTAAEFEAFLAFKAASKS